MRICALVIFSLCFLVLQADACPNVAGSIYGAGAPSCGAGVGAPFYGAGAPFYGAGAPFYGAGVGAPFYGNGGVIFTGRRRGAFFVATGGNGFAGNGGRRGGFLRRR